MRTSVETGIEGEDLREADITFSLRGRDLELKGTQLLFWIQGYGGRKGYYMDRVLYNWALTSQPVGEDVLSGEVWRGVHLRLDNDERR